MAAELLAILLKSNLAAAAAILLVLALRKPTRRVFGARAAYGLWLLPPLTGVASLLPARTVVIPYAASTQPVANGVVPIATQTPIASSFDTGTALIVLWLAGALISFVLLAWSQARFMRSLGGVVREGAFLRAKAAAAGPAVLGALFPRIVLPADFETRYDANEQKVVLAHEVAHLAAGDALANALTALAQSLYWFNPLVHLAARTLRIDQELACDAAVLAAYPSERRVYAHALLKTQLAATPLPLGCYWPAGASNPLKERIAMLKSAVPSRSRRLCGTVGVVALCLGAGAAAWAAQPARIEIVAQQDVAASPVPAAVRDGREAQLAIAAPSPASGSDAQSVEVRTGSPATAQQQTAVTPSGRSFQRVDAPPTKAPDNTLVVTTGEGRIMTYFLPIDLPLPPEPPRPSGWVPVPLEELPEPDDIQHAKRVIAAAKAEQARRSTTGEPPQPLTRELASALTSVPRFERRALARRMEIHKLERRQSRQLALKFFDDSIASTTDLVERQKFIDGREKYIRLIIESD